MKYRKLRIAWSVAWGVAALLLITLWVRSYRHYDWLGGLAVALPKGGFTTGCLFESANGVVVVLYAGGFWKSLPYLAYVGTSPAEVHFRVTGDDCESARRGFRAMVYPTGTIRLSAPHWFLFLVTGVVSAASWIRWRFTLRTLLIVMTVAAIGLGWLVYALR